MVYPNGSVKIIDRSKNIFKLSQGEYIAPEKIEGVYVLSPWIAQSLIYGDSLKNCTVGIVVPDFDNAKKWATTNGKYLILTNLTRFILGKPVEIASILLDPDFKKVIMDDMQHLSAKNKLSGLEKPRDIYLTADVFSVDNNLLTPTFKLKRNIAREHFKPQITVMYDELTKKGF
jgi:long-chain acyl-CoA synthetase